MAHVQTQPTLLTPRTALLRASERVGLMGTAAWCALHLATQQPNPITSRPCLTEQLLQFLEQAGILIRCSSPSGAPHRAVYEPVAWRYCDIDLPSTEIQAALDEALQLRLAEDDGIIRNALWRLLADGDSEAYLVSLLQRHRLDSGDIQTLILAIRAEWAPYSVGRRRYLAWLSVRHAAATFSQGNFGTDAAYADLQTHLRRRGRWLAARQSQRGLADDEYSFVPNAHWRRPILLELFLTRIAPMGEKFWTLPPPQTS
ncbi:hypothetical protein FHY22_000686 [Xanthomonas arboricola]|nr:hypothetical protein [Xanthomonas arboricola]